MDNKEKISRINFLVDYLTKCSNAYYNDNKPIISDAQYDALFDELTSLEQETGVILTSSPTQKVGSEVLSQLEKVIHKFPLLSLAKTKDSDEIKKMLNCNDGYLALKIDGLTVELVFEEGQLVEASTRGDGTQGEIITHNAKVFKNIPKVIPLKNTLRITGEAYIDINDFEEINNKIDNDEDKFSTPRNLAAGSVRQLDSSVCNQRNIRFMPFNVLEGMEDINSRVNRIEKLSQIGFDLIPYTFHKTSDSVDTINKAIASLKEKANKQNLPIDGIVFFYDDATYSASLGRTAHHFRDGIAYKFGDPNFETVLKNIKWNISRTGQLTPIALFNPVEIDNTIVERASLHNMTFIKDLKLTSGNNILVSKRNMIIPHVEANLDFNENQEYSLDYPKYCPICKEPTHISITNNGDRTIEVLYCVNPACDGRRIKEFTHFVSKNAMNIDGLSEQTIEKFMEQGWLHSLCDIYTLCEHKDLITVMDGFGEKSYKKLYEAIEKSKNTTLTNLLVAMNIDLIGKSGAMLIDELFGGDIDKFINAIQNNFNFTEIEGFGEKMNLNLKTWFADENNLIEFLNLVKILNVEKKNIAVNENSKFNGKKIVITGTFSKFSRDELTEKLIKCGAKVSGSVSSKTDYVLCGENAGSKLSKANSLSIPVLYENDFIDDI